MTSANHNPNAIEKDQHLTFKDEYENSPFWKLLGIEMDEVNADAVRIKLSMSPQFLNVNRSVHGGIIASMLDTIMGVTLRHQTDAKVATVSLTTQFIAPALEDTTIYGTAKVVHCGRRIATLEAKLESESGEIIASGVGTFVVKR
jgi:uncharacterized protein (TIGR00369 family)